jgi:hypothetical protein
MPIPVFKDINLLEYNSLNGYYTLDLINQHFPNISIIETSQWIERGLLPFKSIDTTETFDHTWLTKSIQDELSNNKTVFVFLFMDYLWSIKPETFFQSLSDALNQFVDDPVYLIKDFDADNLLKVYNINCKKLELPIVILNDILCYQHIKNHIIQEKSTIESNYNYVTLSNTIEFRGFRTDLAESLYDNELADYGLITFKPDYFESLPNKFKKFCKASKQPPFTQREADPIGVKVTRSKKWGMYGAPTSCGYHNIAGIWVSTNAINFLYLEKEFHDIPLVVQGESQMVDFPNTEKSVWPVLFGKLFLTIGRPGTMAWIQRFYDIDISSYADLTFDSSKTAKIHEFQLVKENRLSYSEYRQEIDKRRINDLTTKNKELIKDASDMYKQLEPHLKKASETFGENLYKFFISQVESVYE